MTLLVTGGAGFIGSNFVHVWLRGHDERIVNLDKLTYAGNLANVREWANDPRHVFVKGDIGDRALVQALLAEHQPRAVLNFAAESHVDRSIHGPGDFIQTNIVGTFHLLECVRDYWSGLSNERQQAFRLLHVSTDEVYGSLAPADPAFAETHAYQPNSPYSASKAASDHLVRAWHHTYGLPVVLSNCSNNYGPWQFPEKLIPVVILAAAAGQPIPLYGDGANVRDWLHVEDHVDGLLLAACRGALGQSYCIGGGDGELPNRTVVHSICDLLDQRQPAGAPHRRLITAVGDRPGHDRRYAIDASRIRQELGWQPRHRFQEGLAATVDWFLAHQDWCNSVRQQG